MNWDQNVAVRNSIPRRKGQGKPKGWFRKEHCCTTRMIAHAHPYKSTPGVILFSIIFPTVTLSPGYVDYRTPFGSTPENISSQKYHTRWTPFTHKTHTTVRMLVPAWRQLLRPITVGPSSLRPGPHRHLVLPCLERGSRRYFPPGPPRPPVPALVSCRCSNPDGYQCR